MKDLNIFFQVDLNHLFKNVMMYIFYSLLYSSERSQKPFIYYLHNVFFCFPLVSFKKICFPTAALTSFQINSELVRIHFNFVRNHSKKYSNALNVFYTWLNTQMRLYLSRFRKTSQDEMLHEKTSAKKAQQLFRFLVKDFKILDIF